VARDVPTLDGSLRRTIRRTVCAPGRRRARCESPLLRFYLLHLDGRDVSGLPLVERKALLEPLVANKPGLQFNGHATSDGELILKHAGKPGFEGVVSKTIDAPMRLEIAAYGAKPKR